MTRETRIFGLGLLCIFAIAACTVALFGVDIFLLHDPMSLGIVAAEGAAAVSAADLKAVTDKLADVTKQFNAKSEELTQRADQAMKEAKDKGALAEATKAECDKLLVEHTTLTAAKNKLEAELAETKARVTGVEQELVRRPGLPGAAANKSVAARMIEDDGFKAFASAGSGGARGKYRFKVNAAITSVDYPASEPSINAPQRLPGTLEMLKQRLFVRDLIPVGQTESPAIFWVKQTGFTNNARVVSEGTAKPESTISYDGVMTPVTTIAHTFKASKQILDDFKQLRTDIDREMRYGLKYAEEREILFGDGTGIHLEGIVPQATAYSAAFTPEMETAIDTLRLAILQAQLARLPATGIVLHMTDWARIETTKDANGQYIFTNPLRLATPTLWGKPIVETEIPEFEDHFLTGAFAGGAQIYDREEMNVEIATENEDDFVKNMVTGRCEERIALAVFRPEAFIWGFFGSVSGSG